MSNFQSVFQRFMSLRDIVAMSAVNVRARANTPIQHLVDECMPMRETTTIVWGPSESAPKTEYPAESIGGDGFGDDNYDDAVMGMRLFGEEPANSRMHEVRNIVPALTKPTRYSYFVFALAIYERAMNGIDKRQVRIEVLHSHDDPYDPSIVSIQEMLRVLKSQKSFNVRKKSTRGDDAHSDVLCVIFIPLPGDVVFESYGKMYIIKDITRESITLASSK